MNSKERVRAALERKPTDRIPIFMWFHPDTVESLAAYLEIPPINVEAAFGNDIRQTWVNNNFAMEGVVHSSDGEGHTDLWGIEWIRRYGFNQIEGFPLRGVDRGSVLEYRFPKEHSNELMAPMKEIVEGRGEYYIGCDVSPCAFEMYWRLRGMDDALTDFAFDEPLAEIMIGRCADFAISLSETAIQRFNLDWLWTGDDVASQQGMIMSPSQWREIVKPHLGRLFRCGLDAGLPVAYHCCGALRPIIPDLIEIGCDVLNPIQSGCPGMEPESLKSEFGGDLAFMGGVDTQELIPRGTPSEVQSETEKLISIMASGGGGFILAASHSIPPETPVENIFALYRGAGVSKEQILDAAADLRSGNATLSGL